MSTLLHSTTSQINTPRAVAPALSLGTRLGRAFGGLALALLIVALGYLMLRPTLLRWGATDADVAAALPGDLDGLRWTRAVAIDASPAEVWPWLVQWGQGRGGWYSYDWLENLLGFDIHSASSILPEHQNPAIGDPICLANGVCFLNISVIEPERALVFQGIDPDGNAFWSFTLALTPIDADHTRLVLRESFAPGALPDAALYALEVADVVMEQKTLDTLKILAEGDDLEDAEEYDLTGSTEADMDLNRISDESPVGAALIGCKVGDSVDVTLPNGNIITYKLLEVSRSK